MSKRARSEAHATHVECVFRPGKPDGALERVPDKLYGDTDHPVKAENHGHVTLEQFEVFANPEGPPIEAFPDFSKALSEMPEADSDEAVDLRECRRPGRRLVLLMDENGRLKGLSPVTVGGSHFYGVVTLVAMHYDPNTGYEFWNDVTEADVAALSARMRERVLLQTQHLRSIEATGGAVNRME